MSIAIAGIVNLVLTPIIVPLGVIVGWMATAMWHDLRIGGVLLGLGAIIMIVFPLWLLPRFWRLWRYRQRFIASIDEQGIRIWLRDALTLLRWDEIISMRTVPLQASTFVVLRVTEPERYSTRLDRGLGGGLWINLTHAKSRQAFFDAVETFRPAA